MKKKNKKTKSRVFLRQQSLGDRDRDREISQRWYHYMISLSHASKNVLFFLQI